jgi:DNA-directed RNA polymerase II subunit RPB1
MREYQMKASCDFLVLKDEFFQPIYYSRIIDNIKNYKSENNTKLQIRYIIEEIERILSHECTPLMLLINKDKNPCKYKDEIICKFLFKIMLYEYLSPKKCIVNYKFSKERFDKFLITENTTPNLLLGVVSLNKLGFYKYNIYEQESTTNLNPLFVKKVYVS